MPQSLNFSSSCSTSLAWMWKSFSRKDHRAVLDPDLHAVIFRQGHERLPRFQKTGPVVVHALCPVASNERVYVLQTELRRGRDHALQMVDRGSCHFRIRIEGFGII